ncbi:MAG: hypothetical protein SNJ78_01265 [Spirochaetales bacterium]
MKRGTIFFKFFVGLLILLFGCSTDTDDSTSPINVSTLPVIESVACGHFHTIIIKNDGTLWATGLNQDGQLGTGNTNGTKTFIQVLEDVKEVAASYHRTMVLMKDDSLWGTGLNDYGQLGTGDFNNNSLIFIKIFQ